MPSAFTVRHNAAQAIIDARHGEPFRLVPRVNRACDVTRSAPVIRAGVFHEAPAESRHEMNGKVGGLSVPGLPAGTRVVVISFQRSQIPPEWRSATVPYGIRRGDLVVRQDDGTAWAVEDVEPGGPSRIELRVLEAKE